MKRLIPALLVILSLYGTTTAHAALPPRVTMPQLTAIAVTLSGHADTTIECDGPKTFAKMLAKAGVTVAKGTEVDGFVNHPLLPDGTTDTTRFINIIHLPSAECRALQFVRRDDPIAGKSLAAFIHESTHLLLVSDDEGLVECTAYQNRWQAVQPLHLAAHVSRDVQQQMTYFHTQTLSAYRTDC